MPRSKARQQATLGGSPDEVEAAFYEALQNGDLEKLMACWSDEDDVVCVHPGSARLVGPGTISASFEAMFSNQPIRAYPHQVRRIQSLSHAVHSVIERIVVPTAEGLQEGYVIATNVYSKTAQGWRMVAHHASPATQSEMQEVAERAGTLH